MSRRPFLLICESARSFDPTIVLPSMIEIVDGFISPIFPENTIGADLEPAIYKSTDEFMKAFKLDPESLTGATHLFFCRLVVTNEDGGVHGRVELQGQGATVALSGGMSRAAAIVRALDIAHVLGDVIRVDGAAYARKE